MKGSINTRNKVLNKFKKATPVLVPDDTVDVDFTMSDESITYETTTKKVEAKDYRLLGDDDLDIRRKSIKKGTAVIIEFKINKQNAFPYTLFKLYKNSKNKLVFHKSNVKNEEIPEINGADYTGLYMHEGVQYLFFHINDDDNFAVNISAADKSYFLLIHDIVNTKKHYSFEVDSDVSDFFVKNDKFIFLVDEKDTLIETPISGYRGDYYKKIGLLAGLGMSRSGPYSSLGPFFYFGNFDRSMRYAALTIDGKPLEVIGKKITIENSPVFTKGGIVKFALFMGNSKVLLNLPNDEEDDSYESVMLASERKFIKDTMKLRDTNGKWTSLYNSVVQPELKLFDRDLEIDRVLDPQFIVKTFEQQIPLDYAYFKTSHITKDDNGMYRVTDLTMI
jgi:hypothetical protein